MDRFTQEVEGLLEGESPTLYRHLIKIFDNQHGRSEQSLSHNHIRSIIHHCLQEIFVGMFACKSSTRNENDFI